MIPLLTSEQMRQLDANAIQTIGIPGVVLMENAALSVLNIIDERFGEVDLLTAAIFCGPGNNGGDGFALARLLHLRGADVDVFVLSDPAKLKGDALTNYKLLEPLSIPVMRITEEAKDLDFHEYDLLIDAIFGTGTARPPQGVYQTVIRAINDSPSNVVAVDVPSGVDASTGRAPGEAVWADVTVTFQHAKIGLAIPPGKDFAGDVVVTPISIPPHEDILNEVGLSLAEDDDAADLLVPRLPDAHKGDFGNLLIVAGSVGMSGAARLASLAALRMGAGLVKVAVPESIRPEVASYVPEVMTIGLTETAAGTIASAAMDRLTETMDWADALAVGPGFGRDRDTAGFLESLLSAGKPMIIDADALNLIAEHSLLKAVTTHTVLTPHPGELARLLGERHDEFPDRLAAARRFALDHGLVLLLKGAPTITFDESGYGIVNSTGNPGLATAGSGDVLTGMIGSLLAQGLEPHSAAWLAAYLHGRAADLAAEELNESSLIAGDVIDYLPDAIDSIQMLLGRDEPPEDGV